MRRVLQLLALTVLLVAVAGWVSRGAHLGWTKTSVPVRTMDEVTGLEGISYESRFVPGLDLLSAALVVAGTLAAVSLLVRAKTNSQPKP